MKRKVILFILLIAFVIILISITTIFVQESGTDKEIFISQLSEQEAKVNDLNNILMNKDQKIQELEEKLVSLNYEKEFSKEIIPTNGLEHKDIYSYYLSWCSSLWGERVVYKDYYLAFLKKLLYNTNYYWAIEEVEFSEEELNAIESTNDDISLFIKFQFNNSISTSFMGSPIDVDELIIVPKEEDSQLYIKSGDIWHSYVVQDTDLSFDIQLLSTIMDLDYERDMYVNRQ